MRINPFQAIAASLVILASAGLAEVLGLTN